MGEFVYIALADEFKLSETYLLSSQTINRKLPISCKNLSGEYDFQPLLIYFRLVIGKTHEIAIENSAVLHVAKTPPLKGGV